MRLRRLTATLTLSTTLLATPALAERGAGRVKRVAPPTEASKAERAARAHFEAAERAFTVGRFADALARYQAAYEALPLPAFLFNVAQCYRNLRNHEQAVFFYERYLALEPNPPNRGVVQDLIAEEKRRVPARRERPAAVAAADPAARQEPAPRDPAAAPAAPEPPAVDLTPAPPEEPATKATHLVEDPAREAPTPSSDRRRWWMWGAVGAVVVGGVAAALAVGRSGPPKGDLGAIDARRGASSSRE